MQVVERIREVPEGQRVVAAPGAASPACECHPEPIFGCSFWKGRVALFAILKALGIGPGDRVLVPGYTCFVVPSAVRFTGGEPVYADIDPLTYNVSVESLAAAYDARVKAVVVQHTYGIPADAGAIGVAPHDIALGVDAHG